MAKTQKSYRQRFLEYRSGVCPYCGSKEKVSLDVNAKGYRGYCPKCKAENNFTNPVCEEWYLGYVEGTAERKV